MTLRRHAAATNKPSVELDLEKLVTGIANFVASKPAITDDASFGAFIDGLAFTDAQLGAAVRAFLKALIKVSPAGS